MKNNFFGSANFLQGNVKIVHFLGPLLHFDAEQLFHKILIIKTINVCHKRNMHIHFTLMQWKTSQVITDHLKRTRPKAGTVGKGAVSSVASVSRYTGVQWL
jgi:hypothetical protein